MITNITQSLERLADQLVESSAETLACIAAMRAELAALNEQIQALTVCPTYGILTRPGIDAQWQQLVKTELYQSFAVVFFDLDFMHSLNEALGYEEVDRRIRESLSQVRQRERIKTGRWYSGDEIILLVPTEEAQAAAQRIRRALQANDLSATFGIQPCVSACLITNVRGAAALVQRAKAEGRRGSINS